MKYLTAPEVLVLHARTIDETGGLYGVRDAGLLHSAVERPKMIFDGKELYPDLFTKAAAYFESLVRNHAFLDGNKRTAVLATARFLFLNGYELIATNKELERFTIRVATVKSDLDTIAVWLKRRSKKLGNR